MSEYSRDHGQRALPERRDESASQVSAVAPAAGPTCLRCGFVVSTRPWGCKNPCGNCGFIYPLGDCSD